jgi:hypothetical protein
MGVHDNPLSGWPIDVGNVTTYQVTGLTLDTDYYFAITAYNPQGFESGESNEVFVRVTNVIPAPASALTVLSTSP